MDFVQLSNAQGLHLVKCLGCDKPGGLIPYHPDDDTRYDTRGRVAVLMDGSLAFPFKGGIALTLRNSLSYGLACMSCGFDYGLIRPVEIEKRDFFAPVLAKQYRKALEVKAEPVDVGEGSTGDTDLPKPVALPKFVPKAEAPPKPEPKTVPATNHNPRPRLPIGGYTGEL